MLFFPPIASSCAGITIFESMEDNTSWTPSPDDNKLGLIDKNIINEYEAKGIAAAELFVFELDSDTQFSTQLLLKIHRIAFENFMIGLESGVQRK